VEPAGLQEIFYKTSRMVVFACNACGASVKKNQVEKHYQQQCRRCESLSCMDCGKDFWGEEYKNHIKCISEDQKYAAKGWQPKASTNKGERKQEAWIEAINKAVSDSRDMSPALRQVLSTLTQHSNIPRKKKKFENFVSNSVHVRNQALVEQAWKVFEAAVAKPKEDEAPKPADQGTSTETGPGAENGQEKGSSVPAPKKKKKRKEASAADEAENEQEESNSAPVQKKKKKRKECLAEDQQDPELPAPDSAEHKKSKREKKQERSKKKNKGGVSKDNETTKKKRRLQDEEEQLNGAEANGGAPHGKKQKLDKDSTEQLNATLDESALMSVHRPGKFDWTGVVLAVLGTQEDKELPMKKLRKKVMSEFQSRGGDGKPDTTREEIWAKLEKKLKRMPQVKVLRDNVKLVSA